MTAKRPPTYSFGPYRLTPHRQLLLRGDVPVRLGGRALDILTVLVERPGEIVSKSDLVARVWPHTFVEDGNLKVNMAGLRRALGDGPASPRYISTVVGRGYRFVAPVEIANEESASADEASGTPRNHNLPTSTVRIVGREDAIGAIERDLAETRLVSIVGPGGVGKTTVALAVAERAIGQAKDGIWLVDLSPLKEPTLVPSAIATAMGLAAQSANMLAALGEFLRDRETVLVLDSCEHVIDGAASSVDSILADAAGVRILATSREPLRLKGERVRRLPGLELPATAVELDAGSALAFPAVELFVERATDRLESFSLTDADAPLVAEICRRLDGLALAIELAATRVDAFGIPGLLAQLDDRLSLLQGYRGTIERHRTLTATIDWSYNLLSDIERLVMRRLAVLNSTFGLESAVAVASDDRLDRAGIAATLADLVSKSLVSAEVCDREMEYRQLDSTRAFALEKLAACGELGLARRRHAERLLTLLGEANGDTERLAKPEWLARHGGKIDDIRAALDWAFSDPSAGALGVRLTVLAIPFAKQLSLVDECRIAVARALDDRFAAARGPCDDLILNLTLGATLLHSRGPLAEVKTALAKALAIAEGLDDTDLQLECLRGLSEYELWTGDSRSAIAVAAKIQALKSRGEVSAEGDANAQTGSALSWLGVLGAARHRLETVVSKPVSHDGRSDVARFEFDQRLTAQGALAAVLWLQGFPDQARETARRQLEQAEASEYAISLCCALLHGSLIIAMYNRDYEMAWRHYHRGLKHAAKHGLFIWRNMGFCAGGRLRLYAGLPIDLVAYRDAMTELREGGFRMRYPNYLTNYGEALARAGNMEGGLAAIDEAMALCRSSGQVVGIPEILRIKGNTIRFGRPENWTDAVDCYQASIELARADGALSWELRSSASLVRLWREHGGSAEAEAGLQDIYSKFTEGFETGDLRRARALIETRPAR